MYEIIIRKATVADLDGILDIYDEHFRYEREHGAITKFKEGVYPTRRDAQAALDRDALYVLTADGTAAATVVIDRSQPSEYSDIDWAVKAGEMDCAVIHLLMVRHSTAGRGLATALLTYAENQAKADGCAALRLDTGAQNTPAVSLYRKFGFEVRGRTSMKIGGAIEHKDHLFLEKLL